MLPHVYKYIYIHDNKARGKGRADYTLKDCYTCKYIVY